MLHRRFHHLRLYFTSLIPPGPLSIEGEDVHRSGPKLDKQWWKAVRRTDKIRHLGGIGRPPVRTKTAAGGWLLGVAPATFWVATARSAVVDVLSTSIMLVRAPNLTQKHNKASKRAKKARTKPAEYYYSFIFIFLFGGRIHNPDKNGTRREDVRENPDKIRQVCAA